jgi:glycosyltransferase involved in cell wall biosynthesis
MEPTEVHCDSTECHIDPIQQLELQRPWRLLFVANVSWFFVMHRLPIALMARERGADVHVACGEGPGAEDIMAHGFPFHPLPMSRKAFTPFRDLRAIGSLADLYRKLQPEIVHHVTLKPVIYGSIAARLAGTAAMVNAFAGLGYAFADTSAIGLVRRYVIETLLALSVRHPKQRVVFENRDDYQLLTQRGSIPSKQAMVISGIGVDTSQYQPGSEADRELSVVFASRMLREKGVEYFVEAARRLRARGIGARFMLIGVPDPTNPGSIAEGQLSAWHHEGVIEWHGFRRDMPQVLQRASVVCLPTFYREGVPRILIEAAACGLPLIATDMPGCRDIVRPEINGLLVRPHDVSGLADAMERLLRDHDLRRRFGAESRRIAEAEFAVEKVLDSFWDVYSALRNS